MIRYLKFVKFSAKRFFWLPIFLLCYRSFNMPIEIVSHATSFLFDFFVLCKLQFLYLFIQIFYHRKLYMTAFDAVALTSCTCATALHKATFYN